MAATVTIDTPKSRNQKFEGYGKVRFGTMNLGTYATNGVAVTPQMFALRTLDHLDVGMSIDGAIGYMWDKPNGKIKAFTAFGTEAGAVDLSAKTFRFMAKGT